jgi:hypothetical protein
MPRVFICFTHMDAYQRRGYLNIVGESSHFRLVTEGGANGNCHYI